MNTRPNYRFSIEKGRQVSSLESGVDSLRRLLKPGRIRREQESVNSNSPSSYKMPNNRNGRAEVNGESDRNSTGSSRKGGPSGNSYTNRAGSGTENDGEGGASSGNNNIRGRGNRRNREATESQPSIDLGPYADHIRELSKAHKNLGDRFAKDADQILRVPKIHAEWDDLKKRIDQQRSTIAELREISRDQQEEFAEDRAEIERNREALESKRKELETYKRDEEQKMRAQEARDRAKLDNEFRQLQEKRDNEHKDRRQKLEQEWENRDAAHAKRLDDLRAKNELLTSKLNEQLKEVEKQKEVAKKATGQCENLEMAIDGWKKRTRELDTRLRAMKDEFAAESRPEEFYKEEFAKISRVIEDISSRYFADFIDLPSDEFEDNGLIHKALSAANPIFKFTPISDSEESQNLRLASAQYIISAALCEVIWQPFSTEKTFTNPEFIPTLNEIYAELVKMSHGGGGGRMPGVFNIVTVRALRSLSTTSTSSPPSINQGLPSPHNRSERVVHDIVSILSPLILSPKESEFRMEISSLAQDAISVWDLAQLDELEIKVSPTLHPVNRDEWRSEKFDPVPSSNDKTGQEIFSSEHPQIFTLFPHITGRKQVDKPSAVTDMPGGWVETGSETLTTEVCIHNGTGLPESSALVRRGRAEVEEARNAILNYKLNARSKPGHSRSGSTTEPSSPTALWRGMSYGTKTVIEE